MCTNNTGDLQRFAMDSLDSLVVVYYSHSTARNVSTLLGDLDSLWRALADEDLELDVVAMEYTAEAIPDLQLDGELFSVPHVLSDSISMPLLVIYEGWLQADVDHAVSLLQQRQYRELGRWYQGPEVARYISLSCEVDCVSIMKQEVLSWAGSTSIASGALLAGSTVSMQLRAIQGIKLLRSAMSIRPLHPEVLYFLSEFAVHAGDAGWEEASEALMRAEDSYDRFRIILSIPRLTFASLYHKLAAAYEKVWKYDVQCDLWWA